MQTERDLLEESAIVRVLGADAVEEEGLGEKGIAVGSREARGMPGFI